MASSKRPSADGNREAKQRKSSDTSDQGRPLKSDASDQGHRKEVVQRASTKEVFLMFPGLMGVLHNTRSSMAGKFRDWVYKLAFTLVLGTEKQMKEIMGVLCKIGKTFLQAFMKLVSNDLACIYLVDIAKRVGDAKIYKFGRSGKMKDRFYNHSSFGDGTLLDTIIFAPINMLSEAETILKQSIAAEARYNYEEVEEFDTLNDADRKATEPNDADRKATELIKLTNEDRTAVRTIMRTIADKYNGSMTIQASKHDDEIKELKYAHQTDIDGLKSTYELSIKDLKCAIAVFKEQMETANERVRTTELRYEKQMEIEKLRLEKQMESEKQRLEIERQRLEIAQLKAAA